MQSSAWFLCEKFLQKASYFLEFGEYRLDVAYAASFSNEHNAKCLQQFR